MIATNHAVTGALIGASVHSAPLAIVLAVLSHFVLDAVPHYDPPGTSEQRIATRSFTYQLVVDAAACLGLVCLLFGVGFHAWLLMAACAFAATSPDLMWIERYVLAQQGRADRAPTGFIRKFHARIQWKTGPQLWWVEALWLAAAGLLLWNIVR